MLTQQKVTLDEFMQFVYEPENADRMFELINGEIVEKMPGRASNSAISAKLIIKTGSFCEQNNLPYFISGEAGSYLVLDHIYMPDFAYRTIPLSTEYPEPIPPLWVVEVISPTDRLKDVTNKRRVYLQAGILYWELDPEDQRIDVYAPDQPMRSYGSGDTIEVGDLIPGLSIIVSELFT